MSPPLPSQHKTRIIFNIRFIGVANYNLIDGIHDLRDSRIRGIRGFEGFARGGGYAAGM